MGSSLAFSDARLVAVVGEVRARGSRIVKLASRSTGEVLSRDDVIQHADVAVWQAFTELGGSLDAIEAFPWGTTREHAGVVVGIEEALIRVALANLRNELLGRSSAYGDYRARMEPRKDRSMVDKYQWSAWRDGTDDQGRSESQIRTSGGEYQPALAEQERWVYERELLDVLTPLKSVLSPRDLRWLIEREVFDKSLYEQVEEAALASGYTGEHGVEFWRQCNADVLHRVKRTDEGFLLYKKLYCKICSAIFRAKKKAREALGSQWADLARELAA